MIRFTLHQDMGNGIWEINAPSHSSPNSYFLNPKVTGRSS